MARIRSIKPEFWHDELVASWPALSRLAYIALWNESDDEGRLRASMPYLRSRLFPYEQNLDIAVVLRPLVASGRLVLYEIDGQAYGLITNFVKHQVVNRPSKSRLPPPPTNGSGGPHGGFTEDSVSAPGGLTSGREGNKDKDLTPPSQGEMITRFKEREPANPEKSARLFKVVDNG